jgi:hypothetical protein
MGKAYLTQMGLTVSTKCLSEQMTALKDFSSQLVTISLRLITEVLGLGCIGEYADDGDVPPWLRVDSERRQKAEGEGHEKPDGAARHESLRYSWTCRGHSTRDRPERELKLCRINRAFGQFW